MSMRFASSSPTSRTNDSSLPSFVDMMLRGVGISVHRPGGASGSGASARPGEDRQVGGYRRGENAAGISSLFSCRIGRTPDCGGHWPPFRDSSRMRFRSLESL